MEHKTKAVEVSFLKNQKWTGTATRMLTFPVGELADRCLNAWLDITDEGFSHAILPSTQLAERFSTLMESDADQAVGTNSIKPWARSSPACRRTSLPRFSST